MSTGFATGDLVVVAGPDGPRIGEVTAVRASATGVLADVRCERETIHGLLADELTTASEQQVSTLIASITAASTLALQHGLTTPDARTVRDLTLAREHEQRLRDALARRRRADAATDTQAHFSTGDVVAHVTPDERHLAHVMGTAMRDGALCYLLVTDEDDEVEEVDADAVFDPKELKTPDGALPLGSRMRMAGSGSEDASEFEGTIVSMERSGTEWRYSLAFDDGDVFCDLGADELEVL